MLCSARKRGTEMTRAFAILLSLCAAFAPAHAADTFNPSIPESVWQRGEDGSGIHRQSGLRCPVQAGGFRLNGLAPLDNAGLDVACTYDNETGDGLTLYLTRQREGQEFGDLLRISLEGIIAVDPRAKPLAAPLPVIEPGSTTWRGALFGYDNFTIHNGLWLTSLSGWTLKFRATYETAREQDILAALRELTRIARTTVRGP